MRIGRWLRREALLPLLFLIGSGGALYLITRKLYQLDKLRSLNTLTCLLLICYVVYLVLLAISVRHIASSYVLERYNPGDPRSIRRLLRKLRYRLPGSWNGTVFKTVFPVQLGREGFKLESKDHLTGFVYARADHRFWTRRRFIDRVMLLESSNINIFRIDQLLKDCVYQLDRIERKSQRNVLIIAVRMDQAVDVASAAAGCVNYLGRFQNGTLFPVLLDLNRRRFYYPANRSGISRRHRFFQNQILALIRHGGPDSRQQKPSSDPLALQRIDPAVPEDGLKAGSEKWLQVVEKPQEQKEKNRDDNRPDDAGAFVYREVRAEKITEGGADGSRNPNGEEDLPVDEIRNQ